MQENESVKSDIPVYAEYVFQVFASGVNGVPVLVKNCATALAQRGARVRIACPRGSFIAGYFTEHPTPGIVLCDQDEPYSISPGALLITWGGWGLPRKLLAANPKVLMWCIMGGSLESHVRRMAGRIPGVGQRWEKRVVQRILSAMRERGGLAFMDEATQNYYINRFGFSGGESYLPIPLNPPEIDDLEGLPASHSADAPFTLTWVGRGTDIPMKVIPLVGFINRMILPAGRKIRLDIYTDDAAAYRERFARNGCDRRVEIRYFINLFGAELQRRLRTESDLHLGMGTAVLEGARLGLPALCIDPVRVNTREFFAWSWIFERKNYNVGDFYAQDNVDTPFDLAFLIDNPELQKAYAADSLEYVRNNHSIEAVADKLATWRSEMSLADYCRAHGLFFRAAMFLAEHLVKY